MISAHDLAITKEHAQHVRLYLHENNPLAPYITFSSIVIRDQPIFGFYWYIGIGQNGRYNRPQ